MSSRRLMFSQAARSLGVTCATVSRWCHPGLSDIRLDHVRYGSRRAGCRCYTTPEALVAFVREVRAAGVRGISDDVAARAENLLPQ